MQTRLTSFHTKPRKQLKKTPFKSAKTFGLKPKKPKAKKKREKLPTVKTMRKKCDNLLTPIVKKMYPYCLLTGMPT